VTRDSDEFLQPEVHSSFEDNMSITEVKKVGNGIGEDAKTSYTFTAGPSSAGEHITSSPSHMLPRLDLDDGIGWPSTAPAPESPTRKAVHRVAIDDASTQAIAEMAFARFRSKQTSLQRRHSTMANRVVEIGEVSTDDAAPSSGRRSRTLSAGNVPLSGQPNGVRTVLLSSAEYTRMLYSKEGSPATVKHNQ